MVFNARSGMETTNQFLIKLKTMARSSWVTDRDDGGSVHVLDLVERPRLTEPQKASVQDFAREINVKYSKAEIEYLILLLVERPRLTEPQKASVQDFAREGGRRQSLNEFGWHPLRVGMA
jgi:hypothetical protein